MLKAAKNMRGKLALLYRVTGRPGHRLHIFLNSTYEQKVGLSNRGPPNSTYNLAFTLTFGATQRITPLILLY